MIATRLIAWLAGKWPEIAVCALVCGVLVGAGATGYQMKAKRAAAEIAALKAAHEAELMKAQVAAFDQAVKARTQERDAAKITERVADALSTDRERERRRADSLAGRLRDYADRVCPGPVPGVPDGPGGAARAGQDGGGRELGAACAAVAAESLDNAAKVRGWQQWYAEQRANSP